MPKTVVASFGQAVAVGFLGGLPDHTGLSQEFRCALRDRTRTEHYTPEQILANLGKDIDRYFFSGTGRHQGVKGRWDVYTRLRLPAPKSFFEFTDLLHAHTLEAWQNGYYDDDRLILDHFPAQKYFAAVMMAVNTILASVVCKYDLPARKRIGYIEGLRREIEVLESLVPSSNWTATVKALVAEAFTQEWLDQEACFAPIKIRPAESSGVCDRPDEPNRSREPRYDVYRLLAHMKNGGYVGMRALPNRNSSEYSALTFAGPDELNSIVLMDTPKVNNAIYYYVGPLETLVALLLPLGDNFARAEALRPYQRGRTIHLGDWETRSRAKVTLLRRNTADTSDN